MPRTGKFIKYRRVSALCEVAAHEAEDLITAAQTSNLFKLIFVSVMKWIVFANYSTKFHFFSLLFFTFFLNWCIMSGNRFL